MTDLTALKQAIIAALDDPATVILSAPPTYCIVDGQTLAPSEPEQPPDDPGEPDPPLDLSAQAAFATAISGTVVTVTDRAAGAVKSVSYTFGDGPTVVPGTAGGSVRHTYAGAGTYTITQIVTAQDASTSTAAVRVTCVVAQSPLGTPPLSPQGKPGAGMQEIRVETIDPLDRTWTGTAYVGEDQTAPGVYCALVDASGSPHTGLTMTAYSHCVDVGAVRCDQQYSWVNFKSLRVWRNGVEIPVPPPTDPAGKYHFQRDTYQTVPFPGVEVAWDAAKIDRSLMPNFAAGVQNPVTFDRARAAWNGASIDGVRYMGMQGDDTKLGYFPIWVMAFLTNPTQATFDVMLRGDISAGVKPCAFRNPATNGALSIIEYPEFALPGQQPGRPGNPYAKYLGVRDGDSVTTDTPTLDNFRDRLFNNWDTAHHPAFYFVTAMVTDSAWAKDHASDIATGAATECVVSSRKLYGVFEGRQERETAWCLRSFLLAAHVSSATAYWAQVLDVQRQCADAHIGNNPYGIMGTMIKDLGNMAWWQEGYMAMVLGALYRKIPAWRPYAEWLARGTVNFMDRVLYPFTCCYQLWAFDDAGRWLPNVRAIFAKTITNNNGFTQADADAVMAPGATLLDVYTVVQARNARMAAYERWPMKYVDGRLDFGEYPTGPLSYPVLMRVRCALAYELGVPGGADAWAICQSVPQLPDFTKDWRANIVPRPA